MAVSKTLLLLPSVFLPSRPILFENHDR